jgi:hypothetical protein
MTPWLSEMVCISYPLATHIRNIQYGCKNIGRQSQPAGSALRRRPEGALKYRQALNVAILRNEQFQRGCGAIDRMQCNLPLRWRLAANYIQDFIEYSSNRADSNRRFRLLSPTSCRYDNEICIPLIGPGCCPNEDQESAYPNRPTQTLGCNLQSECARRFEGF